MLKWRARVDAGLGGCVKRVLMMASLSAALAGCATEIYAPPRYVAPVPITPAHDASFVPRVDRGAASQEQFDLHMGICRNAGVAQLNLQGVHLAYNPGLASKETGDQIYQRWVTFCMTQKGYRLISG